MIYQGHQYHIIGDGAERRVVIIDSANNIIIDEAINLLVEGVRITNEVVERFINFKTFGAKITFRRFLRWA